MKLKRFIIIIISILLLLMLILVGYEISIKLDGKLDKNNYMNREEIIELVKKDYSNYKITTKEAFTNRTGNVFVKDNIFKNVVNNKCIEYGDYNSDERIYCFYPFAYISYAKDYNTDAYGKNSQLSGESYYNIMDENKYDFEYLGEKKINGRETIVIKLAEVYHTKDYYKYYIDKETGIILGREYLYKILGIVLIKIPSYTSVEFDCVTDEDVKRPNIIGYVVNDFRELSEEE